MSSGPLPFRLPAPGNESVSLGGIKSVSYKFHGLMHVTASTVTLEWAGTQTTEQFTFEKIGTDVDRLPVEWLELPMDEVVAVRVIGGWWRPRFELRARLLDSLEGVPGARGATVHLRIARRDRAVARSLATEIERHLGTNTLPESKHPQLGQ